MNDTLVIESAQWSRFRQMVGSVNTDLCRVLEHPLIDECCEFVPLEYGFGDLVVQDSQLQIPRSTVLSTPINDPDDCFFLVLNKPLEQFFVSYSRIISLNIFYPGSVIHLPQCQRALAGDFDLPWQLSAGIRTLFLLPKITDNMGYNRLRLAYQLTAMKPLRNLYDQWHLFRQIAQHPDIARSWRANLLMIRKKPGLNPERAAVWQRIRDYVEDDKNKLELGYSRPIASDILWQRFLEIADPRRFKLKSHLVETIKYLCAICNGLAPGFVPANQQNTVAPIADLQQAFTEVYKLRNYIPTFMHLSYLEHSTPQMLYYSLAVPLFVNHHVTCAAMPTSQRELFELKQVIDAMKGHIKSWKLEQYRLKFCHVLSNEVLGLESSLSIPEEDPRFLADHGEDREFCPSSIFWRGCIRLQKA